MEITSLEKSEPMVLSNKRRKRHQMIREAVELAELLSARFIGFWNYARVFEHKETGERIYARRVGQQWVFPQSDIKKNLMFTHLEQFFPENPPKNEEILHPIKWLQRN